MSALDPTSGAVNPTSTYGSKDSDQTDVESRTDTVSRDVLVPDSNRPISIIQEPPSRLNITFEGDNKNKIAQIYNFIANVNSVNISKDRKSELLWKHAIDLFQYYPCGSLAVARTIPSGITRDLAIAEIAEKFAKIKEFEKTYSAIDEIENDQLKDSTMRIVDTMF